MIWEDELQFDSESEDDREPGWSNSHGSAWGAQPSEAASAPKTMTDVHNAKGVGFPELNLVARFSFVAY
eukprot:6151875-Amphidinium_carterae.1